MTMRKTSLDPIWPAPARLDHFGEVLTLRDLARLVQVGPRYFERITAWQKRTGRWVLPDPIPGLGYRFTAAAVAKWLKAGMPDVREFRRIA